MVGLASPILAIGAGRSGSTLLSRIFNQHPQIYFGGDNSFLVPRLWLELWEDRFWFNAERYVQSKPSSAIQDLPKVEPELLEQQKNRVGKIIANALAELYQLDFSVYRCWGYKEIWNGSSQFDYPWAYYDWVFPQACWVHLIRNPFLFARSSARWNQDSLTLDYLQERLYDWVAMTNKANQRQQDKVLYYQVRYEDIVADANVSLTPILQAVGLDWHDDCLLALKKFDLKSQQQTASKPAICCSMEQLTELANKIPGLNPLMQQLDYQIPAEFNQYIVAKQQQNRSSFAKLNMMDNSISQQKHQPQHLLQQKIVALQLQTQQQGRSQQWLNKTKTLVHKIFN